MSARGLATGRVDVRAPLTERGKRQARALARELADEDIDLCVISELERTRQTAEMALAGRSVPQLAIPELNDPLYGAFESGPLDAYRAWAVANNSSAEPPGGGEARRTIVARYAAGLRRVAQRPERTILVVIHSLPIAYVLLALSGRDPSPRVPLVDYATTHPLSVAELEQVVARLEAWSATPTW